MHESNFLVSSALDHTREVSPHEMANAIRLSARGTGWKPLQFGHFETVKPGEILDFSPGESFWFFLLASEFRSV